MAAKEILVVDDEMGIRELLSEILFDEGYRVYLAENAAQARDFRNRQAPDLVLLDIWMPDMDGLALLKEWAAQGQLTMPVIMMSGHGTIETAVEATRIGAMDFLEKPIALKKLLDAVARAITRSGAPDAAHPGAEPQAAPAARTAEKGECTIPEDWLEMPLRTAREHFESAYFAHHLRAENGNITRVAEKVGLERTHLYRKLKQLGIKFAKRDGDDA
ncbi:MAG TPA: response regulator [Gallionellaceae bacterium]|nr:response regulator [Gallionellaceae bacterium]